MRAIAKMANGFYRFGRTSDKDRDDIVFSGMKSTQITIPARLPIMANRRWNAWAWGSVGTTALCVLGQVQLDWVADVPITLQTLVVVVLPVLLGSSIGTMAVVGYVLLGAIGLPVFSGGRGGWEVLAGPTGGFLIGFIAAAWLTGQMVHSRWGNQWLALLLSILAGHQLVLLIGLPWYGWQQGWAKVMPLWSDLTPGMLLKVLLATLVAWLFRAILRKWG